MRALRILVCAGAVLLLLAPSAGARPGAEAPSGLRPFLLRADEPLKRSFPRTPGFAWKPVAGALRYEFQLSTSNSFRENGVVYSDTTLTSPVAAPSLTLPWITGEPHALYARVRAVLEDDTTPWSTPYGFDMEPSAIPSPLPTQPGLLRWTPVDGATSYEVWFVDIPKVIRTTTNVADQREFYTFHQAASWLSQVRWRVRARRLDFNTRANGLPASMVGPWSPVYVSVNPPFATGPLRPTATVSDIVATGSPGSAAHRLMPAFVFGGNERAPGFANELYRVHVFTDRRCVNRVYSSTVVGSPAYAPRASGPLVLPRTSAAVTAARGSYLRDGEEGPGFLADGSAVQANESMPGVKATTTLPAGAAAAPAAPAAPSAPAGESGSSGGSGSPAPSSGKDDKGAPVELLKAAGTFGPPVDIWDTDWASGGGYYWTVVPVNVVVQDAASTTVAAATAVGATTLPVSSTAGFTAGDTVAIGTGGTSESATITALTPTTITVAAALRFAHNGGEAVARTNGGIDYVDAELAQDACASGRVMRFGKESEPTVTNAGEPFVTGLAPGGTLSSADEEPEFFGAPLVAWTPALGASVYAVQWSRTRQPFRPETDPATGAQGMLTANTSVVLPLDTGTWYYRVRGYSFSLPTGSQALSWSDVQKIVGAKPEFKIVDSSLSAGGGDLKLLRVPSGGFSVRLPQSWATGGLRGAQSAAKGPLLSPLGQGALKLAAPDGKGSALFVQSGADAEPLSGSDWKRAVVAGFKGMKGRKGAIACSSVSLPAGAGVRCALTARVRGGSQSAVVYALQHRGATYTLTFATTKADAKKRALFTQIARSFRFTA